MDPKEIVALKNLSITDLEQILKYRGPYGLVQESPVFKDAIMVNLGILFLAVGIPLMIVSSIAISMYNDYIESQEKTEDHGKFSSLNSTQILFLIIAVACIIIGLVFVGVNAGRRSKVEFLAIQEYGVEMVKGFMKTT
jgi:Trk-type K+ transport system membrane component